MSIQIVPIKTLSATVVEGQRILVKFDTNEWYAGDVVKQLPRNRMEVQYGDGTTGIVNQLTDIFFPVNLPRLLRNKISDSEARYYKKNATPPAAKRTPKSEEGSEFWSGMPERLEKVYGPDWGKASNDRLSAYCELIWTWFNKHKFGGRMSAPNFRLMKNSGTKFRTRGMWQPGSRFIAFSPRLFMSPFENFLRVFLHEMCHQAVSEIDKVRDRTSGGHGPNWTTWMRKVGLTPNRFDLAEHDVYLTDEEIKVKRQVEEKRERVKKTVEQTERRVSPYDLQTGGVVKFINPNTGESTNAILVSRNGKTAGRWVVITEYGSHMIVPTEWFYKTNWVAPDYLRNEVGNLKTQVLVQQTVRKQRRRLRGFW